MLLTHYKVYGYADFYYREPHLSYFSRKTLGSALKKAGFVGEIGNVQRYNVLNHIHWIQTGQPQPDFKIGNARPELVRGAKDAGGKALNNFVQKTDIEYKKVLERSWLGESLTFFGKKRF